MGAEFEMGSQVCPHCDTWVEDHDYEHSARHCYPRQVERLEARLLLAEAVVEAARNRMRACDPENDCWEQCSEAFKDQLTRALARYDAGRAPQDREPAGHPKKREP